MILSAHACIDDVSTSIEIARRFDGVTTRYQQCQTSLRYHCCSLLADLLTVNPWLSGFLVCIDRVSARAVHETRKTGQQVQRNVSRVCRCIFMQRRNSTNALSSRKRSLDAEIATLSQRQKRDDDWKSTYDVTGTLTACLEAQNLPDYQAAVTGVSCFARGLKQAKYLKEVLVVYPSCYFW